MSRSVTTLTWRRIESAITHPRRDLRRIPKFAEAYLGRFFANTAFRLQSQMAIHPESFYHDSKFVEQTGGFMIPGDPVKREIRNLDPTDLVRRDMLILLLRTMLKQQVAGDLAELGVYQGRTARLFHHYAPDRVLHLLDTFEGFDPRDLNDRDLLDTSEVKSLFSDTSVSAVTRYIRPINDNLRFYRGRFPSTVTQDFANTTFAFVHLDADLYEPTTAGLKFFYPRLSKGGMIVIHDYNAWYGAREAVDEFFADKSEVALPMPDSTGSAVVVKI